MKYLITIFLTFFIAQAEQKIEIFDAQGNKIKEVIRNGIKKENIIEPHELKAHNQEMKIQKKKKIKNHRMMKNCQIATKKYIKQTIKQKKNQAMNMSYKQADILKA